MDFVERWSHELGADEIGVVWRMRLISAMSEAWSNQPTTRPPVGLVQGAGAPQRRVTPDRHPANRQVNDAFA
jgi:hypothetical protein